jgi:DNA-binding Lrp family transcriptional regulator
MINPFDRNETLDDLDTRLISLLRHDGRRSVSDLASDLKVSRATVRTRMEKLIESGEILGFTAVLRDDWRDLPIRAITLVQVDGQNTDPVAKALGAMTEVRAIHSTNGKWDLILEIATRDLAAFDDALHRIRLIDGIAGSETNILLSTRKGPAVSANVFKDVLG